MTTKKPSWLLTYGEPDPGEIHDSLIRLVVAIQAWAKTEDAALDAKIEQFQQDHGGEIPDGYDGFSDASYWMRETERTMFAGLAVAIASAAEPFRKAFIAKRKAAGETEKVANRELASIAGHSDYNRARILANCFKHSDGNVNDDYVSTYQDHREVGEKIDYSAENWTSIIDGLRRFLRQVCGT